MGVRDCTPFFSIIRKCHLQRAFTEKLLPSEDIGTTAAYRYITTSGRNAAQDRQLYCQTART